MQAIFQNRNFTTMENPPRLRSLEFSEISYTDRGGAYGLNLTGRGDLRQLAQFVEMLRCPVTVYNDLNMPVWVGCIWKVTLNRGLLSIGFSLDDFANVVTVKYTLKSANATTMGLAAETAAVTNATSVSTYGTKQFRASGGDLSAAGAAQLAAAVLDKKKYPRGIVSRAGRGEDSVTIECRGWFDVLDWQYASWAAVSGPSYTTTAGAADQSVGAAAANNMAMQQFTVSGAAINLLTVQVYGKKVGAPVDNLNLGVYALDASGNPSGSPLASVTLAGGSLSTSLGWIGGTFGTAINLAPGQYGLRVDRSGANNGTNYYVVQVNAALGYTGGAFKLWNGSAWVARGTDADMLFQTAVDDQVDNVLQAQDLVNTYAQYMTGVILEPGTLSGAKTGSYREGDTTALSEVNRMLDLGGPNQRRLICRVDEQRRLVISEEPSSASAAFTMDSKGDIYDIYGPKLTPSFGWRTVGKWVAFTDMLPGSADTSRLLDAQMQYVEGGTLQPGENGEWVFAPKFRGNAGEDILGVG